MTVCECEKKFAQVFPFWEKITAQQRENLCAHTAHTKFSKGSHIHGGSNECTGGILVNSGCVRVYIMSDEGKEVTLYRLYPGELCMLSASCVLKSVTFDVYVDAEEDTDCYIINGNTFAEISETNVYAENFALNVAVTRFSDVMWIIQQILFMSLDRRLAIFLYDEMSKTGSDTIHLTHEQIAKYIGSAREAVSRMLKYFADESIIDVQRKGIKIINKEKLRILAVD